MRTALAVCLALTLTNFAAAGDWPQWLGPNRDGSSPEVVNPWTGNPKVLWHVPVGEGHSSPVVANGQVYLLDKVPDKSDERVRIWDARTGQPRPLELASWSVKPFSSPFGNGPRSTPTVVGDTLYGLGVSGDFVILRFGSEGGVNRVTFNVLERFHAPNLRFGLSASPLVEGDNVLLAVGGKGASVVALDRKTGETTWKVLNDPASYASPIAFDAGGQRQAVFLTAEAVVSLDPKTGDLLWRYPFRDLLSESSTTPVKMGDLLIVSSVSLGSAALRLTTKDGKPAAEQAWKNPQLSCYFSTPVAVGDKHVYMVTGSLAAVMSRKPEATLQCVEAATGKSVWSRPKVGKYHAALTRTGDGKLLMLEDTGDLVLIDPGPAGYKELARAKVCGQTWAHPALADGRLYLRDEKELICLQLPQ